MTKARIYRPDENPMQSGKGKDAWLLEFIPDKPHFTDSLMGWTGMSDTLREICMRFPSREAAEAYAKRQGIDYEVIMPKTPHQIRKAYADNFRYNKISN